MDKILGLYCNVVARLVSAREDERGQGTLEYVGMVVVAAGIIFAVMQTNLGDSIANALKTAVDKVIGG